MTLQQRAAQYLSVSLPVLDTILKSAFRRASRELHPDLNPLAGDQFVQMKRAYDDIIKAGLVVMSDETKNGTEQALRTVDGALLSELGLGLGPTTNGRPCDPCNGRGYISYREPSYLNRCGPCDGSGRVVFCKACQGSGKFIQKNSRRVVDCLRCKGQGATPYNWLHFTYDATTCKNCNGTGHAQDLKARRLYQRCGSCQGAGEIKIYNPVIIKGSMAAMSQKERKRLQREDL
jgi:DnaJ-class molecular chaperone